MSVPAGINAVRGVFGFGAGGAGGGGASALADTGGGSAGLTGSALIWTWDSGAAGEVTGAVSGAEGVGSGAGATLVWWEALRDATGTGFGFGTGVTCGVVDSGTAGRSIAGTGAGGGVCATITGAGTGLDRKA